MKARTAGAMRWFVGLSLILGALALLAGAIGLQASSPSNPWLDLLIVIAVLAMVVLAALEQSTAWPPAWPWYAPAALPVLLLMMGVVWAHVATPGHFFLSGFAPFVAFLTGLGILERRPWAWPVAFASVTGFGPTILLFAPLSLGTVYAALVLFIVDAVCLLALVQSYFEPSSA